MRDDDGAHQMLWMDDEEAQEAEHVSSTVGQGSDRAAVLEAELASTKQELAEVRRDLAAKTVQLTRREKVVLDEKVQAIAATVNEERDAQLQQALAQVSQLQIAVAVKEEELEESRRLYAGQKRALRDAISAVAEREASEKDAEDANRTAHAQAIEDELDALTHELAMTQARADMEGKARESELSSLRQQLANAASHRKQAVADAESALSEAWEAEVARLKGEANERHGELERQLVRLMTEMEDARRAESSPSLTSELAELNKQKVQVQREFESFKDMAMQTSRTNREEVAKLLEENAQLHARLAATTVDLAGPSTSGRPMAAPKLFEALDNSLGLEQYLPDFLAKLERQRKGVVPFMIVGALLLLILLVAVTRAAANTRAQHKGSLCFLSNLGIRIGRGCQDPMAKESLVEMMEKDVHRVHDVKDLATTASPRKLLMHVIARTSHVIMRHITLLNESATSY